jgi:hypothetical protein
MGPTCDDDARLLTKLSFIQEPKENRANKDTTALKNIFPGYRIKLPIQ